LLGFLLSSISVPDGSLALDVGCGVGSNLDVFTGRGLTIFGMDLSFEAIRFAKQRHKSGFIRGNISRLPVRAQSFGLIIAMDILEHLQDDIAGITSLHNALKDKGILILTVPAFQFLWGIQDIVTGHERRYSRNQLIHILRQGGFEILRSSYFNFFLFFPILAARVIMRLIRPRIPSENIVNTPMINYLLKTIFSIEPFLLKYVSFPFGVSIFCVARKRNS
jgi:SAM-dependent methyltransferase